MSKQIISLFFDSVFEFFASFENGNFTCRDFQRSFGFGIDAFTSFAVCNADINPHRKLQIVLTWTTDDITLQESKI